MNDHCTECGMFVGSAAAYHPFLFCELYRLGHSDPAAYLASYGFVRAPDVAGPIVNCMRLCPDCGNKRCPRASGPEGECTASNDPGQIGARVAAPEGSEQR